MNTPEQNTPLPPAPQPVGLEQKMVGTPALTLVDVSTPLVDAAMKLHGQRADTLIGHEVWMSKLAVGLEVRLAQLTAERDEAKREVVKLTEVDFKNAALIEKIQDERDESNRNLEGARRVNARLTQESLKDADTIAALQQQVEALKFSLQSIVDLGRKDTTNPKYDDYYTHANVLLGK